MWGAGRTCGLTLHSPQRGPAPRPAQVARGDNAGTLGTAGALRPPCPLVEECEASLFLAVFP